jgi:hypothetical protein
MKERKNEKEKDDKRKSYPPKPVKSFGPAIVAPRDCKNRNLTVEGERKKEGRKEGKKETKRSALTFQHERR